MCDKYYYYIVLIDYVNDLKKYEQYEFESIKEAEKFYKEKVNDYMFNNEEDLKISLLECGYYCEYEALIYSILIGGNRNEI